MKTVKKALLSTVIALAAFESIPSSQAAPVTWVSGSGDLFLGFENAAGNLNYLYDLGAGSTFAASVLAGTYAGVNLNADLTSVSTWTGNTPSTTPFATYNVTFENLVSGNLDFYGTTGTTSTLKGTLQISQAGVFGVVAAVPEPSTYALCGLGAIAMIVAYRRKSKKAA